MASRSSAGGAVFESIAKASRRAFAGRRLNTFDRYLLREWLQILGLVLSALVGLLLVHVMYDDFMDLMNLKAGAADIAAYFIVTLPRFLALLLPLTLLVSLLYVLGQMHRNHEFTALRAAGVSLWRITRPVWFVGLACCSLMWWLNSDVVPWSVEHSRSVIERLEFRQQAGALSSDRIGAATSVAFDHRSAGRVWFINRYSRFTQRGYGVTISQLRQDRREVTRLVAAQAWRQESGRGWILKEGREMTFDPETGTVIRNQPFKEKACPQFDEEPELMLLIDRPAERLSFRELERLIAHLESVSSPKLTAYAVRYHSLLADTLSPLIVIGLAIPFAVAGVRVNPAVGVSKSLVFFVLYYVLSKLGSSLATQHYLTVELAAWLPHLGMAAVAAWLIVRLR